MSVNVIVNITHRQLKAFVLVAHLQNFSRASEQLHIAQSGLSLMVRELESQIGFRLFNRTTRKVSLTPFGVEFLNIAEQTVQNLEQSVARVREMARQSNMYFSIGAPPMTCSYVLPDAVMQLEKQYPELRVTVIDTDIVNVSNLVRTGQVDIGLGMFLKATPSTVRHPLFKFSLVVASASTKFQLSKTPVTWLYVVKEDLISLPHDNPLQQLINHNLQQAGSLRTPKFVVNFIETQLGLAAAGCGVAIVPSTAIAACRGHAVKIQPLADPAIDLEFYSLRDRGRELSRAGVEFCEIMKRSLQRMMRTG